jgi:hypothetical protein
MALYYTINNASALLTAPHTMGDNVLHVSPISVFGNNFPLRVTCVRQSDNANFICSIGSSGATTLNITGFLEGTSDINLAIGDTCQSDVTAGTILDIHNAISAINSSGASGVVIGNPVGNSIASGITFVDSNKNLQQSSTLKYNDSSGVLYTPYSAIGFSNTTIPAAQAHIKCISTTLPGQIIQAHPSGNTSNLWEIRDLNNNTKTFIASGGNRMTVGGNNDLGHQFTVVGPTTAVTLSLYAPSNNKLSYFQDDGSNFNFAGANRAVYRAPGHVFASYDSANVWGVITDLGAVAFGSGNTSPNTAKFEINHSANHNVSTLLKGQTGATGDALHIRTADNTLVAKISASGAASFTNSVLVDGVRLTKITELTAVSGQNPAISGVIPFAAGGTNNTNNYSNGSITFSDGNRIIQDNHNFFWDRSNFRMGILTNSPAGHLHIKTSGVPGILVQDINGNELYSVSNFGTMFFQGTDYIYRPSPSLLSTNASLSIDGGLIINNAQALANSAPMFRVRGQFGFTNLLTRWEDPLGIAMAYITASGEMGTNGIYSPIFSVSTNYTLTNTDDMVLANASGGPIVITLLNAGLINRGREFTIKKIDNSMNLVYISGVAGQTIDGVNVQSIDTQWNSLTIKSLSGSWYIK